MKRVLRLSRRVWTFESLFGFFFSLSGLEGFGVMALVFVYIQG